MGYDSKLHDAVMMRWLRIRNSWLVLYPKQNPSETELNFEYKKSAVKFWKSGKNKKLSLSSVIHKYRKVTSIMQMYCWEKYVLQGGSKRDKLMVKLLDFTKIRRLRTINWLSMILTSKSGSCKWREVNLKILKQVPHGYWILKRPTRLYLEK